MAQRRMFNKTITNNDNFLEMPQTSQNLYFHLSMNADDDGFVDNWKSIMRMTGCKEDDLKVLIAKQYIIPFESGVIVIRHWRLNNYLRNDRFTPTNYQQELSQLTLENGLVYQMDTNGIHSIGKDSIDKYSIDNYYNIDKFIEENYPNLTPYEYDKLKNHCSSSSEDIVIYALQKGIENKNKSLSYIEGILRNLKRNNLNTLEEVLEAEEKHKTKNTKKWWEVEDE